MIDDRHRRDVLYGIADALAARGREVVAVAGRETRLTQARLRGELDSTTSQLRLLGDHVAAGRRRVARRSPGAAPGGGDIVTTVVPIGPVAVFAASNLPLVSGVLGGDTASALAAGCPVAVKAHPAQPETSRLLAAIADSVIGDPAMFSLVEGDTSETSLLLVRRPDIRAVAFTGSLQCGRALLAAAMSRPDPIPVYAEMGSLNPVFVLPGALGNDTYVEALAGAVTESAGQLRTKPGLVVVPDTQEGDKFAEALAFAVSRVHLDERMLTVDTDAMHRAWEAANLRAGVTVVSPPLRPVLAPRCFAVRTTGAALEGDLLVEHFGPSVVIANAPVSGYPDILRRLEGSLTATLLGAESDLDTARALLSGLTALAGRVIWNGVPTGVAICDAMHHGGPWPATTAPWSTSVGPSAVDRFVRPVALQNLPESLLP